MARGTVNNEEQYEVLKDNAGPEGGKATAKKS